jgi:hypothetical protein
MSPGSAALLWQGSSGSQGTVAAAGSGDSMRRAAKMKPAVPLTGDLVVFFISLLLHSIPANTVPQVETPQNRR